MASLNSASQDCQMVDMDHLADGVVNLTSPQASVDVTSKDIIMVQEELERRLKQRVGRHDLVQRNILPPLALPTAPKLFTQTQQLQKARLADNLQKKLRNRADRSDLMQLNILPDLQMNIDPGLHAKHLQLKKNKLADQLNDKLAKRPGPLQLLKEGILDPTLREMVKEIEFEPPEGSAEAKGLSPLSETSPLKDTPHSSEGSYDRKLSDSSISPAPSPEEAKSPIKSPYSQTQSPRDFAAVYPHTNLPRATQTPGILSSGIGKAPSPSQARKSKQKQQKYRKLRYHEYVPPSKNNGKGGKTTPKPPPKSDSPYSLILQQQQMFLQLQVLQQQYPNGVLMQKLPDLLSTLSKDQKTLALAAVKGGRVPVTSPSADGTNRPVGLASSVPQVLQVDQPNKHNVSTIRFDDLKVNDLKAACKELGMIVSGKKAELVERLLEHNKGLLPSIALPDGLNKDSKRQSFSTNHTSSIDSQHSVSSLLSPKSPSTSPVFTFPSDHRGGQSTHGVLNGMKPPSNPPPCRVESMPTMPLPEVFPATTLQQEFDEMIEQQKLNYMNRRGPLGKSLAPRPELNGLVAIRVPPAYSSTHNTQLDSNQMPSARAKGSTLPLRTDSSKFLMADKSSRSLPSSPQPLSPNDGLLNLMDDTPAPETHENKHLAASSGAVMSSMSHITKTVMSDTTSSLPASIAGTVSSHSMVSASESVFLVPSSVPMSITTTASIHNSASDSSFFHNKMTMRPNRSSVPIPPMHAKIHPMHPPSYGSQLMQRSISLSGPPQHVPVGMGAPRMHTGASFGSDISDIVSPSGGEAGKPATPDNVLMSEHQGGGYMDMPMDTDHNLTEIFEILRADGSVADSAHPSQPHSLPAYPHIPSHHSHNAPHHTSYGSPTKLNSRQDSVQSDSIMLGGVMPFGNPPLGIQNRTGSDICLNIPREGQKNSTGSTHGGTNVMLSEELQWLDLDCANTFGVSPTMNSGFSNLNRHSNPGSLQHDQFHVNFLEDSVHHSGLDGGMRSLNQDFNSGVPVNGMHSFLDTGIPHPSGLFPASEESTLLELGLSTS